MSWLFTYRVSLHHKKTLEKFALCEVNQAWKTQRFSPTGNALNGRHRFNRSMISSH